MSGTFALLVAAALLSTFGCSFILVQPPPEYPAPGERLNCTTSVAPPAIDVVMTLLHLVAFGIVESGSSKTQKTLVQIDAPLAGVQIGAAIYGFRKVGACNDLMAGIPYRDRPRPISPSQAPGIEPKPPSWREPGIEPPPPGQEPSGPRTPGQEPGIEPPPPAPPVRHQIDNE